ncbi:hypothetical protein AAZX31_02G224200 [Glycine max]|nr:nijmegen breakage syndrome 1 protein-like [Glycine soja]XP_040869298.1 nijmegen breakage syndrome 1 protein [Glycine max]KAH1061818.1 hypothetical protein GYH30_005029 [Glycine max]KRH72892.2 hypothetical protein GLYMA_02G239200v4 [Glycine max]
MDVYGCDVIITKDKGVSRVHAEIVVNTMNPVNPLPNERSHLSHSIHIRDCSKYGTFISKNDGAKKKVHELPNKDTALEDGDLVSFGTGTATYKFCHVPLVFFICSSNKVDRSLEEKISSIGAGITHTLGEGCTHVLVDQLMPLKKDLVDAVVTKKSCVLKNWLEFFAKKNISTEIPSCHSYIPTVSVEGESIKIADPRMREDCLKGYTFLLESEHLYKFGDQLKPLLEVAGAKVVSSEDFCSDSQGTDYGEDNRVVCVIPGGPACKSNLFNKLSSLLRVTEMDVICAAFSGQLDLSILKSPCLLVSSSCSTDETIVADSDTEVETATPAPSNDAFSNGNNVKYGKTEELYDDSDPLDKRKHERIEASSDDVSTRLHDIKHAKTETSLDGASARSHSTSFRNANDGIKIKKGMVDDYESGNSDMVYSQYLVVRDTNICTIISTAPNSSVPNFKHFRKAQTQSGNSFDNLVPFGKYPYKDSDCGNEDVTELVKKEKRQKKMEAMADDMFHNEARKRGTVGSLRGILTS